MLAWVFAVSSFGAPPDKSPLSSSDAGKLAEEKVLITNEVYRQSFSPYTAGNLPVFITSDAILNAWHVLLEDSLARLEVRQARVLGEMLHHLWDRLPRSAADVKGDDRLRDAAKRRASLTLAVAMELLGEPASGLSQKDAAFVKAKAAELEAVKVKVLSGQRSLPDEVFPDFDLNSFAADPLRSRTRRERRFDRCVAWLQAQTFRVSDSEKCLAALMIGNALIREQPSMGGAKGNWYLQPSFEAFFRVRHELHGGADSLDLPALAYPSRWAAPFMISGDEEVLSVKMERLAGDFGKPESAPGVRLLPLANNRVDHLFSRSGTGVPPAGMEVAAVLGSTFAMDWLKAHSSLSLVEAVQISRERWKTDSQKPLAFHDAYLNCLASLVDAPEKEAPAFMRTGTWQRKSCTALLAGWTQMRRPAKIQPKADVLIDDGQAREREAGFVEPDPVFFRQLSGLSVEVFSMLSDMKALEENVEGDVIADLERTRDHYRLLSGHPEKEDQAGHAEANTNNRGYTRLLLLGLPDALKNGPPEPGGEETGDGKSLRVAATGKWNGAMSAFAEKVLKELDAAPQAERDAMVRRMALVGSVSFHRRWLDFIVLTTRLEALAEKQLRQEAFTETDRNTIRETGSVLARCMFYDTNSYMGPRGDAAKIAGILATPSGYLHAAIGRPRRMYVLYPWQGKEVLCAGSVVPYYEFTDATVIGDAAWRQKLETGGVAEPEWCAKRAE